MSSPVLEFHGEEEEEEGRWKAVVYLGPECIEKLDERNEGGAGGEGDGEGEEGGAR